MKRMATLLAIGLVCFGGTAAGISSVAGLSVWASLALGLAVGVSTPGVIVILSREGSPVSWTGAQLGGFLFFLGLFMIGNGVLCWFYTSPATSLISLLSGLLYSGSGAAVTLRSRSAARE